MYVSVSHYMQVHPNPNKEAEGTRPSQEVMFPAKDEEVPQTSRPGCLLNGPQLEVSSLLSDFSTWAL